MERYAILHGDCLEVMRGMDAASVDAIVTDPPYGLSFMGKDWDHGVPGVHFWEAALAVAKPGTHLLAFGGTRTFHRLACAIEDAGWEIRDTVMWVYGSGFPKSHNLDGKWSGWGTALKPAWEPIIVARKPLAGTVAANVIQHGTGAINVDGCRIPSGGEACTGGARDGSSAKHTHEGWNRPWKHDPKACEAMARRKAEYEAKSAQLGRWPANLIHDGSEEVVGPMGSAARFFYCAKASKADRDEGCEGLAAKVNPRLCDTGYESPTRMDGKPCSVQRNNHPTVKPTALMRYLCRLVTPTGGVVLDPFAGSGSTGKAAMLEGFNFIGIELNSEYVDIARARIANAAVVV